MSLVQPDVAAQASRGTAHCLLVDDDPLVRRTLARVLQSQGMSTVEVENLTVHDIAMLWARGGFGSARHRRDKGRKKRRLGRAPGAPP